jgi:hypothetical protein
MLGSKSKSNKFGTSAAQHADRNMATVLALTILVDRRPAFKSFKLADAYQSGVGIELGEVRDRGCGRGRGGAGWHRGSLHPVSRLGVQWS